MQAPSDVLVGRQPILDREERLLGYELLFRGAAVDSFAEVALEVQLTARVIVDTFGWMGSDAVLGSSLGFLNTSQELLLSEAVAGLPPGSAVLELDAETAPVPEVRRRIEELRASGLRLCLDRYRPGDPREPLLDLVDFIKVDVDAADGALLASAGHERRPPKTIAMRVESSEEFQRCHALGFDAFQGYYFARPEVLTGERVDAAAMVILRALQQLERDEDPQVIETTIKQNAGLCLSLLRLVNSVSVGPRQEITSIGHALIFLGRRQVHRWLALLLYAADESDAFSPLFETAAVRARMMELLASCALGCDGTTRELGEQAFLAGILSLIEVIFKTPMDQILEELCVDARIRAALLERAGLLGGLLLLVEELERADFERVAQSFERLGLGSEQVLEAQIEAYGWANGLESPATA